MIDYELEKQKAQDELTADMKAAQEKYTAKMENIIKAESQQKQDELKGKYKLNE
jgi:cytochrome c556